VAMLLSVYSVVLEWPHHEFTAYDIMRVINTVVVRYEGVPEVSEKAVGRALRCLVDDGYIPVDRVGPGVYLKREI